MSNSLTNPKELSGPWAGGNQYTCSAMGFIYVLSATAANFYNMFMSIHFYRIITTTKKRTVVSQSTEQRDECFRLVAHLVSVLIPLLFSIAGIVTNSYHSHEFNGVCYYQEYPHRCSEDPDVPCERGSKAELLGRLRLGVISISAIISITVTILLTVHVWRHIKRSRQYSLRQQLAKGSNFLQSSRSCEINASTRSLQLKPRPRPQDRPNNKKQRDVAVQAIWYVLAYLNPIVFIIVASVVVNTTDAKENRAKPGPYTILVLLWLFLPLQGALNFIVFIRPRYKAWKSHFEKEGDPESNLMPPFLSILSKAILEPVPTACRRQSRKGGFGSPHGIDKTALQHLDRGESLSNKGHSKYTPSPWEEYQSNGEGFSRAFPLTVPEDARGNEGELPSKASKDNGLSFQDAEESAILGVEQDESAIFGIEQDDSEMSHTEADDPGFIPEQNTLHERDASVSPSPNPKDDGETHFA